MQAPYEDHPQIIPYPQFVEKLSFRNQCQKGWGPLLLGRLLSREGISVYVSVLFLGTPVMESTHHAYDHSILVDPQCL